MAINVLWDSDEQIIVRWDFAEHWDWHEIARATQQSVELRESATHDKPVSIILNLSNGIPFKAGSLNQMYKVFTFSPEGRGLVVVVGKSIYVESIVEIFRRRYVAAAESFVTAENLHDARRLIERFIEGRDY